MIVRDSFGCPDVLQKTAELPLIEKSTVLQEIEDRKEEMEDKNVVKNETETTEEASGDSSP